MLLERIKGEGKWIQLLQRGLKRERERELYFLEIRFKIIKMFKLENYYY